ncbi:hypothetical protein TNCV_4853771 [Trichonephila clavipes]|nr:hypothetical protein TNCV_4853771 [Trichonephila clavipes]
MRHYMKERGRVGHTRENPEVLGDPWVMRVRVIDQDKLSKGHSAAEGRPVRSRQMTTVRPCPYYLRSRLKEPEGISEEHWDRQSTAEQPQEKEPQHGLRRRSGR